MGFFLMKNNELIPHLFRTEYGKIVAVLSKLFGIVHIEIAEDLASETFLVAAETWPYNGIPNNPTAWLYTVAKNKAKNHFARNSLFTNKIANELKRDSKDWMDGEIDWSDKNIEDSQLQMMFAICHPSIPEKGQIALALRILCGFSVNEIANAFLCNKDTIHKRLFRAKEILRVENIQLEIPRNSEITQRLDTVLKTLYLLFNEGYYSEYNVLMIRKELCVEAMNLLYVLLQNKHTNQHNTNSLMSLMCFHSSRLDARLSKNGEVILYEDQDTSLWNQTLIEKGFYYLQQASKHDAISPYYLEASIAYWYTVKMDSEEKWKSILYLYDQLLIINYTPIAALNRIIALSKVKGKIEALKELKNLNYKDNHFYFLLMGNLYEGIDYKKAITALEKALHLSHSETEKLTILTKIEKLHSLARSKT